MKLQPQVLPVRTQAATAGVTQETREIWQVTAVIEEDLETTEGSCTLELTDWKVPDKEKRMRP
jgi:hypothetical protein